MYPINLQILSFTWIYKEIQSARLNYKLSKFHFETLPSVHIFFVRLLWAIKGVFSLLTLACFFTEKARCSGCRVNLCRLMWDIYATSVILTFLVNAGNVKGGRLCKEGRLVLRWLKLFFPLSETRLKIFLVIPGISIAVTIFNPIFLQNTKRL